MSTSVLQLKEPKPKDPLAFLELGFRPLFFFATLYAALAAALWLGVYFHGLPLVQAGMPPYFWHAHEMVFGFGFTVVAGFLLTAIRNWTNVQTLNGWPLGALALVWIAARLAFLLHAPWWLALGLEMAFALGVLAGVIHPLWKARHWHNMSIFATKVFLLGLGNLLFYLGWAGVLNDGMRLGLYTGLYILLALLFTMGRRVIPFFIERGIGYPIQLRNSKVVDIASLVALLGLWFAELLAPHSHWTALFALAVAVPQLLRLYWWYAKGMWQKSLIWILWAGIAFISLGLLIKAVADWQQDITLGYAAWHSITYGGIGLITLGMIGRASLGHSGRNVMQPPSWLGPVFAALAVGALVRVLGPLLLPADIIKWSVALAQVIWILVFATFCVRYIPMWRSPPLDRR